MSEAKIKAVHDYLSHFNAQDADAITALYAEGASVTDPYGTEPKIGHDAILAFYKSATANGASLELDGPIRIAGNRAAFSFQVRVGAGGVSSKAVDVELPPGAMSIDVIDTFEFDENDKVTAMTAYWGPTNMTRG